MKILPFIAAANSAFGKSVTDISNLLSFSPINLVGFEIIAGYSLYSGRVGQFKLVLEIKRDPSIRSPLNSVCCPQIVVSGEAVHENLQGLYTRAENKLNGRSKCKLIFTIHLEVNASFSIQHIIK